MQKPQPHGFPVMGTIAPVAMSVVIWLVTRSPFVLMFAALGPAVAIASVADARRQSKRRVRSERARFDRELETAREETRAFHREERRELDLDAPSAAARLTRGDHDPERWAATIASAVLTIGRGTVRSSAVLDLPNAGAPEGLTELADFARELDDAAVTVRAGLGIAVVGPRALAGSVARGFIVQLATLLSPSGTELLVDTPPADDHWFRALPHPLRIEPSLRPGEVAFQQGAARSVIAVAPTVDEAPSHARMVLQTGAAARIERHPDRSRCTPIALEYVSREQARAWAIRLRGLAGSLERSSPPDSVGLAGLFSDGVPGGLAASFGVGAEGPIVVDLVADGPHAVVGGTTGSGKSELLVAWVLALAHAYSPDAVTFLLVDFKGGSSFAPLEHLPHCVGVISDLDERSALRALESLKAEVRVRERMLADARVRSIDELAGTLPRLVIVVDEFAAMVGEYPDLHALFADLAARGRSLGLHLVLCTQRPAGAVRDAVLANAGLRISLRVNNRADSQAVLGTDAAAEVPARPRGRAFLSAAGEPPRELQVALAAPEDSAAVAARWTGTAAPRRPWRDPLPPLVEAASLEPVNGIPLGLLDLPERQAQPTLAWDPGRDGHLLVVGAARSGKSGVLAALSRAPGARAVPDDPDRAWDTVAEVLGRIRAGGGGVALLLDDVDAVLARYSDDHAAAWLEALSAVLREGPSRGVHVALATQRITPALHAIASLCDRRLILRMQSKQDHVIAGGASEGFDPAAPPGRGTWAGQPMQVVRVDAPVLQPPPDLPLVELPVAVVTPAARAFADRARARGASVTDVGSGDDTADVIVGDPEAWQSRWGALQAANATMPVFFERCSPADFRLLTRSRLLPPPLITTPDAGWLLDTDGSIGRARF